MSLAAFPERNEAARCYVAAFQEAGSAAMIENVHTRVTLVECDGHLLPTTINDGAQYNSYVCSPHTHYAAYAREEMRHLGARWLQRSLGGMPTALGGILRHARMDQTVHVNNWMLSTNLYPSAAGVDIAKLTQRLTAEFPNHYIAFRSLNRWANGAWLARFQAAGYRLVGSRRVYRFDHLATTWSTRSNAAHDRRLLRKTRYTVVLHDDLGPEDFARMAELYRQLYLRKYSPHNPAFTAGYLRMCHQRGIMRFCGLRSPKGRLDGILGLFVQEGTATAPVVGYDTTAERQLGLYRLLMTLVFEAALSEGWKVNLSSGAAHFKRLRGGRAETEYSAIYARHLSGARRAALRALQVPVNGLGIPLMRALRL